MKWEGRRQSSNVEKRGSSRGSFGGGEGMIVGGGGLGTVLLLLLFLYLGGGTSVTEQGPTRQPGKVTPQHQDREEFVAVVLADTEEVWHDLFRKMGKTYREPKLVLFYGQVKSACGFASAAVGPFYCPADHHIYLDLTFFRELHQRFKAPGDFAQAYVIAHEVGHHVQNLLGLTNKVHSQQGRVSKAEYNKLSVRLELQADFLAGVWAHHAQKRFDILEPGDLEEAITAAKAIGDDRLQKQSQGYVVPDSFTHGTSAQRARWFRLGFESGDISRMNELFTLDYNKL